VTTARAVSVRDRDHILLHTAGLWEALRGERVFVTGGTGFVGTWLVEAFVAANDAYDLGATVVLLSRDPARFAARAPHLAGHRAVRLVAGDAVDFASPGGRFAFVVHAATEPQNADAAATPLRTLDRDTTATRRVVEFARNAQTQRMLFTSSGAVYGSQPAELLHIPETYGCRSSPARRTVNASGSTS